MHSELSCFPWIFDGIFKIRHSGSASAEETGNNSSVKEVFCFDAFLLEGRKAGEYQHKIPHTKARFTIKTWRFHGDRNILVANSACSEANSSSLHLCSWLLLTADLAMTQLVLSPQSQKKCIESYCLLHNCFLLLSGFIQVNKVLLFWKWECSTPWEA